MPTQADELLYSNAVKWIHENSKDKSIADEIKQDFLNFNTLPPEEKTKLILTLRRLLTTMGLPEAIEQSLPYLTFDLKGLPDDMYDVVTAQLKNDSDRSSLVSVSRNMHSLLQPTRLFDKFLQRVAYGEQDKAEALFTQVYSSNSEKIQKALLHQGRFTDYSGRTFDCSAYEYAYWAKDTHMCRMLERYMDDATKAAMLTRVNEIERTGLSYTQDDVKYCTHHFDFTPLIQALQFYADNYDAWNAAKNWDAMGAAWMKVGLAQRDVPAHVAQEYCRPDRGFSPCPPFNEPVLPRILTFHNWTTSQDESWFPLRSSNSGPGFDFALIRGAMNEWGSGVTIGGDGYIFDLAAVSRLDEVRTVDLTLSREHLNPPAMAQGMVV